MNTLGPYFDPWHWRQADIEFIHALDPAWVLIHQPTARAIYTVQQVAPSAKIMLRSWDIDDSNGERKRELYADPKGAARKHLQLWRAKWDELVGELHKNNWGFNADRWYLQLVNEPDPNYVAQVVEYSLEAMRLIEYRDIRLGLVVSSVGTFSKPSENANGWTLCKPLEKPINDGGHILVVHEYWQPEGPNFGEDAGNLAWRHRSIPLDVPILIGESGANGYIYGRHSQQDDAGWRKFMQPAQYAAQVKTYIEGCDSRVQGVLLYMLDYHSDQWWSFDINPAIPDLLAIKDAKPQMASPFVAVTVPVQTHLPQIGTGPQPVEVQPVTTYSGIIDPLVAQAILNIESGGRAFGDDGRIIIRFEAHIFKTYLGNDALWAQYFRTDPQRPWVNQEWRRSPADPWRQLHTGSQADEWTVFEFANQLNANASFMAISMGAPQIMGFNHARIGYPSAADMYVAFRSAQMQTIGFINFCLSDPGLADAMRRKDWDRIAYLYNGAGAVDTYAPLLEQAYQKLGGA